MTCIYHAYFSDEETEARIQLVRRASSCGIGITTVPSPLPTAWAGQAYKVQHTEMSWPYESQNPRDTWRQGESH
jgi:hypothetical protein